jgi:hypothetical protein
MVRRDFFEFQEALTEGWLAELASRVFPITKSPISRKKIIAIILFPLSKTKMFFMIILLFVMPLRLIGLLGSIVSRLCIYVMYSQHNNTRGWTFAEALFYLLYHEAS